jgi:hypothetical protein
MMIDDPIQYLEGQAHEIELKAIRDLRGGRAGVVRSSIDDKLENVRRTLTTAESAANSFWSAENAKVFKDDELARQAKVYYDMTEKKVLASLDEAKAQAAALQNELEAQALPQRPEATFSHNQTAQEAMLAGLKADYRLVLDRTEPGQVPVKLVELFGRAAQSGDELGAWLLSASDWPGLYLESRGRDTEEWRGRLDQAMEEHEWPEEMQEARRKLAFVKSNGGLAGLMTLHANIADMRLQRLRQALRAR